MLKICIIVIVITESDSVNTKQLQGTQIELKT